MAGPGAGCLRPDFCKGGTNSVEILDTTYNDKLAHALVGRRLNPAFMPEVHRGRPMFSFWGEELGFSGGDVHAQRAYRIYLDYGPEKVIDSVQVVVEGELISPCSGYFPEVLDQFDYPAVLKWCTARTLEP